MNRINLIYDISVLGQGLRDPVSRTGIFRTIENLAHGLDASAECRLEFSAISNFVDCLDYLETNPRLRRTQLAHPQSSLARTVRAIRKHLETNTAYVGGPWNQLKTFSGKKLQSIENKLLPQSQPIDLRALRRVDIFHSSFWGIPALLRYAHKPKKFITLYDLTPILTPQYFEPYQIESFKRILAGIQPDDWVLCISHATQQDVLNYLRRDVQRTIVTQLGVANIFYPCMDTQKIQAVRSRYRIPAGATYFLTLGTLEPRKNIDGVIRSFANLVHESHLRDLYLVIVGEKGWRYSQIFETVTDVNLLSEQIIFTGYVPDTDLAALYSGALAFVYLSFYEGFGLPPLEAMQCGVPVVTSNTSSFPEVIGDAGIMLNPTDHDGLAQNLLALYQQPSLCQELARKGFARAKQFSWMRCTQETIAAYRIALEN